MSELVMFLLAICSMFGIVVGILLMFSGYVTEGGIFGIIGICSLMLVIAVSEIEISKNPELLAVREFCSSQSFSRGSLANLSSSKYVLCSSSGGIFSSGRSEYYTSDEFSNWRDLND